MTQEDFYSLLDRYQNPLFGTIYRMVHAWEEARDLAQDAFVNLWKNHEKMENQRTALTYLYRTAVNLAIDLLRRRKFVPSRLETEPFQIGEDAHDIHELFEVIMKCTMHLKPKQKAVFILRDIEGFDFEEMARLLDMPVSNLRSNLHLARKKIRQTLKAHFNITLEYWYDL